MSHPSLIFSLGHGFKTGQCSVGLYVSFSGKENIRNAGLIQRDFEGIFMHKGSRSCSIPRRPDGPVWGSVRSSSTKTIKPRRGGPCVRPNSFCSRHLGEEKPRDHKSGDQRGGVFEKHIRALSQSPDMKIVIRSINYGQPSHPND